MIRFAELIAALMRPGVDRATVLAHYLTAASDADAHCAMALLSGDRPARRIPPATLRAQILSAAGLPDWLFDAAKAATGDGAEALALILPQIPAHAGDPGLSQTMESLAQLSPDALQQLIENLPPAARALVIRLATGTFRLTLAPEILAEARLRASGQMPAPVPQMPPLHTLAAVMIYAEVAPPPGVEGPELTLALWDGGQPVPIARLRVHLPGVEQAELLGWVRSHATDRFGPVRQVPARQVFVIGFDGVTPNRRRKSGVALLNPRILAWTPAADPATAAQLGVLTALLTNQP